jgi:hypothetical protein
LTSGSQSYIQATVEHTINPATQEVIVEIVIGMGMLIGVFVVLGGAILFFPYDK